MKLTGIRVPGMRIKDGKLVKDERRYDVATQIKRRRGSKRVRVKRPNA
jgi:hypothetical protein